MNTDEQDGRKQTRTTAERTVVSYRICVHLYYKDETLCTAGKHLECGDLSPLLPLWRLVAKAGPRPAARRSRTPYRARRRQVACRKRGQVRALQRGCGSATLCLFAATPISFNVFGQSLFHIAQPGLRFCPESLRFPCSQAVGCNGNSSFWSKVPRCGRRSCAL